MSGDPKAAASNTSTSLFRSRASTTEYAVETDLCDRKGRHPQGPLF
jgi:hypothetical protein